MPPTFASFTVARLQASSSTARARVAGAGDALVGGQRDPRASAAARPSAPGPLTGSSTSSIVLRASARSRSAASSTLQAPLASSRILASGPEQLADRRHLGDVARPARP